MSPALAARLVACLAFAAACAAADAPADASAPAPAPAPASAPAAGSSLVSDEDKWVFAPPVGRPDVFYDYQQLLTLERSAIEQIQQGPKTPGVEEKSEDPVDYAKAQVQRIEVFMSQRKWDEALKVCDQAIKKLGGISNNAEVAKYLQVIKGYQQQAQDALLRDEAQAAFDALNLKVEGILWSENGPRLAIISGEPRALGINDRVKDCVIINIDTDRVDFRYHFKRKRFEFPRYVGEDSKSPK